jgi:uncharacterized protein YcbK (DUF882 family)
MGDLSKNFDRSEFACRGDNCCGHSAPIDPDLIAALQLLRDRIARPLTITSGFRCNRHNAAVGGADNSLHTLGMAADVIPPENMSPEQMAVIAEEIDRFKNGGIGIYPKWVHLDVRRTGKARWRK